MAFALICLLSTFPLVVLTKDIPLHEHLLTQGIDDTERDPKQFFSIIQISPEVCNTDEPLKPKGVCQLPVDCTRKGGVVSGRCAMGYGACCIMEMSCNQNLLMNNTHFNSPGYPDVDKGTGNCAVTVHRVTSNICQMRLDIEEMNLAQPDENGFCIYDFLTVSGATSVTPTICGDNQNQHMYIDVTPDGGPVTVSVDRSSLNFHERRWSIRISQYECTSEYRAPQGCFQYYRTTSGIVNSFNFGRSIDNATSPPATRQIACQEYGVCVRMSEGYCGVYWSRNQHEGPRSFTVSGTVETTNPELLGTSSAATRGDNCTSDYILIPGGRDDEGVYADRYCGVGFPSLVSCSMKPAVMYVKNDCDEIKDTLNHGFSLNYRQVKC